VKGACFLVLIAYAFYNLPFSEGYEKLARAKEGTSNQHLASVEATGNGEDDYDMFADDDEQNTSKPSTDENNAVSQSSSDAIKSGNEGKLASEIFVTDFYLISIYLTVFYFSFRWSIAK